jgi:hypothetical protein
MALSVEEIKKRYKKASTRKEQWRAIYEEAYEYCLPMRNLYDGYYGTDTPGQNKMKRVFDSTAIHSTARFANRIQSALFPPQQSWCRLTPGSDVPPEKKVEAQQVLDLYGEKMFAVMRQSGFDLAMGEFLLDLAVGTAVMLIQKGDEIQPIRYTAVPMFTIAFDDGPNGKPSYIYRKIKRPFEVLQTEFPDITIPNEVSQKFTERPTDTIELLEATYLNDKGSVDYCLVTMEGNHKLLHKELKSMPWVVSRYMLAPSEIYGRGPCLYALPDIKTLNKVVELTLKNASLSIGGVFTAVDDGVLNPQAISIVPGAVIGVSSNGGPRGPSLQALPRSGDVNLSQIIAGDLKANIKKTLLDESLPPDNMSARSATEIVERMKELSQNLGSAFGRLINETMHPIVRRTLELMDEEGMIDLPLKVNGLQVQIAPMSPLAMAGNMEKVGNILQFLQISQSLGQAGMMLIKPEAVGDYILDNLNIDASLRTTPEERQAIIEQAQAMAQAQAEAQQQMMAQQQGGQAPQQQMMEGEQPPAEEAQPLG